MRVSLDATGIEARWRDGRHKRIAWPEVVHIGLIYIFRDDRVFWQDPCYWELQSVAGTRLHIYSREARRSHLLDALESLPGFRRDIAEQAKGCTSVWSRPSVHCPSCGKATLVERHQRGNLRYVRLLGCPHCGHELALGRLV